VLEPTKTQGFEDERGVISPRGANRASSELPMEAKEAPSYGAADPGGGSSDFFPKPSQARIFASKLLMA
jgi:hypothetical protein